MSPTPIPDCQACGACCASPGVDNPTHAHVTPHDIKRMSKRTVRLHVLGSSGDMNTPTAYKYQRGGPLHGGRVCVCSALIGSLMKRTACSIYTERPRVCREFVPGSKRCIESLHEIARAIETYQEEKAA